MKKYVVVLLNSKWFVLNIDDLEDFKETLPTKPNITLISCQTADLIRQLTLDNVKALPKITDLECLDKQMSQIGKDLLDNRPWKVIKALKFHGIVKIDYKITISEIKDFCERLAELYIKFTQASEEENKRYNDIECFINKIIYHRQSLGICIDGEKTSRLCQLLERNIYLIKNQLQLDYRIFSPDNIDEQKAYLSSRGINIIKSIQFTFKAWRNDDKVCRLFYDMLRAQQDLNNLLFMLTHRGGNKKCYPTYYGFGTITSRITLREPSLQNLKKENRVVVVPEKGKKFLYIDYSQFEAGILASLSKDEDLIRLYGDDIYKDIAVKVLDNCDKRSDAKVLFYRYMYGDNSINTKTKEYFSCFKKLEQFKQALKEEIIKNQKIGTINGNFRQRGDDKYEWYLSHKIQATASLIYKQAVIKVSKDVPSANLLVPMHDATLYELDTVTYENDVNKIKDIYIAVFKNNCPEIDPSVKLSDTFY